MALTEKQRSHCKFGAYCSITAGICYAILTLFAFLLQSSIATYITTAIAHAFVIIQLIYLVALGAFVFAPLWGILKGLFLLKLVGGRKPWGGKCMI